MSIQMIESPKAPTPVGPYSQAVIAGPYMFMSGILPINTQTNTLELYNGEVGPQARLVLSTLRDFLSAQGLSLNRVVKTTIFLANMNDFPAINEVYAEFFPEHKPARSCVEVARLPKDAGIEIEAVVLMHA